MLLLVSSYGDTFAVNFPRGRKAEMKAERARRRSTLPMRSQQVAAADRVFDRIKTLTGELEALHADLHGQAKQRGDTAFDTRALTQFKGALDQLRRILWSYQDQSEVIQTRAELPRPHLDFANRADLLEVSHPQGTSPAHSGEPGSFFDRLNVVIDAYMQRNEAGSPAGRKRGKV